MNSRFLVLLGLFALLSSSLACGGDDGGDGGGDGGDGGDANPDSVANDQKAEDPKEDSKEDSDEDDDCKPSEMQCILDAPDGVGRHMKSIKEVDAASIDECCQLCAEEPGCKCKAVNYKLESGVCYLKSTVPPLDSAGKASSGYDSGVMAKGGRLLLLQ